MPATLAEAKADLFAFVADEDGPLIAGVSSAYDYDPGPSLMPGPIALLVVTAGIDPDFWRLAIRLYVDIGSDPQGVQGQLDSIMPAICAAVDGTYGPENWVGPFPHPDREDWRICEWIIECGREDI